MISFTQNPLILGAVAILTGIIVMAAMAYISSQRKINDAKLYASSLNSFLSQRYEQEQALGNTFNVQAVMDPAHKYVKINDQDTKLFYKYPIKWTFVAYTGSKLTAGATVDEKWYNLGNGQVAIGLFTTNDDLNSCNGTGGTNTVYLDANDFTANGPTDICGGFDDTISQVIVAGTPDTIKTIKDKVFKTASNVHEITVNDGSTALSGLVIDLKK